MFFFTNNSSLVSFCVVHFIAFNVKNMWSIEKAGAVCVPTEALSLLEVSSTYQGN